MNSTPTKVRNKIIVIEDDQDINDLVAYNLRKEGFVVEQVFDGTKGHERLKKECFDIVILDIMLPGTSGFDICKELKDSNNPSGSFVIVISAKSRSQDKLYAHILGADCYITKPFNVSQLVNITKEIRSMLEKEFVVVAKG